MAKIFQAMQGNYGSRFLNQWKTGQTIDGGEHAGKDAGLVNAMAFWGVKLAGFAEQPERIRRVLDTLPPDPPSLPQFVELCRMVRIDGNIPALQHKLTGEDHDRIRETAEAAISGMKAKNRDGIDQHWATHPRSAMHLKFIFDAAKNDARFRPCIAEMVRDGICTDGGCLLKSYRDGQWWLVHLRAA